jgi:integrase
MRNLNTIQWLTADETRRLFSSIKNKRDVALFRVGYHHGLRPSEVGKLRVEDVDFTANRIRITRLKKGLGGVYVMPEPESKALRSWIRHAGLHVGPLFPGRLGGSISRRTLDYLMKLYGEKAALPIDKRHFHCLRHSIATHMLEAGENIEVVQDWLGHQNIQNTQVYAKLTNTRRDNAARDRESRMPRV